MTTIELMFSELQRRALRMATTLSRGSSLTFQQYMTLAHLGEVGPCSVTELRAVLGIAQATSSELVTRLEKGGFVVKQRDLKDLRTVKVEISYQGREAVKRRQRAAREFYQELLSQLPEVDQAATMEALETLLRVLPGGEVPRV